MNPSQETSVNRREFVRTASWAATAVASCIGLAVAGAHAAAGQKEEDSCSGPPQSGGRVSEARGAPTPGQGPLGAVDAHVCGLHFYSGDLRRQVIAHHYCSRYSDDVRQCVIYDSGDRHARLVGIEYIIGAALFGTLPDQEKELWHSHVYEVKSGQLTAPDSASPAEQNLMEGLAGTYGKTWYTWQVDRDDKVPLGIPQLMMAFTGDGQVDPVLLAARDRQLGISSEMKRRSRAGLVVPALQPGADAWQGGQAIVLRAEPVPMRVAP